MRLTSKLRMNRLGAYRIAGEPMARRVPTDTVAQAFEAVSAAEAYTTIPSDSQGA